MEFIGDLFMSIGDVILFILDLYIWVIIIAALISWVGPDPYNPIVRFLRSATEPILRPIRRKIGVFGGVDISPLIVIIAILFLKSFIRRIMQ
jgi:YggT family protein